ncbi:signal peptidase complex subunit 2-like isoform X1 [Mytilus californianus]|uniref:signal peptidase complex subunit 2-like isoform X1 n=1 Tax=Mytilus californianus TaxID=6549 RepID=UPI00224855B4|nr:signal peptidase complex subunit 2-like isoform X1 [Mytilus californianus]
MASKKTGLMDKTESEQWKADDKPVKIDKWDCSALKNALDDAAKKVMTENFGFKEEHRLMDLRLLICTVAVGFSLFALVWDYIRPFPESRPILIICVLSYFMLMGVLTLYTTYMEQNIFLVASDKDKAGLEPDDKWELASTLKKYTHLYKLKMTFTNGKTGLSRSEEIERPVNNYFDEDGTLLFKLFEPEVRTLQGRIAAASKKE